MANIIINFFHCLFRNLFRSNGPTFYYEEFSEATLCPGTYLGRIVHLNDTFDFTCGKLIGYEVYIGLLDDHHQEHLVRMIYRYNSPELKEFMNLVDIYKLSDLCHLSGVYERIVIAYSDTGTLQITKRERINPDDCSIDVSKIKVFRRFIETEVYTPEKLDELTIIKVSNNTKGE